MIRKLQTSDTAQVMQIWLNGNIEAHPFISKDYWKSNFAMVQKQLLQAEVWVYELHGEIQGFIGIVDGKIAGIFVDEKHRSRRVGKQLLDTVKAKHKSLSLSAYRKNRRAIAFYLREEFSISEELLDNDTGEMAYTMVWQKAKKREKISYLDS